MVQNSHSFAIFRFSPLAGNEADNVFLEFVFFYCALKFRKRLEFRMLILLRNYITSKSGVLAG